MTSLKSLNPNPEVVSAKRGETYVTRIPVAYKDSVEQLLLLLDSVELSEICNKVVALTDKRQ